MLLLPKAVRIYVAKEPVSLRKSFDGLSNIIRGELGRDPLSGHLFVFINRRRTQVKLLMWTRGGFTILHKRLERGRFSVPKTGPKAASIDVHELSMLLEGLVPQQGRAALRWEPARLPQDIAK